MLPPLRYSTAGDTEQLMRRLRYEKLLEAERSLAGLYVTYPDSGLEARNKGQILAEKVRQEYKTASDASLEEGMESLRGRS